MIQVYKIRDLNNDCRPYPATKEEMVAAIKSEALETYESPDTVTTLDEGDAIYADGLWWYCRVEPDEYDGPF